MNEEGKLNGMDLNRPLRDDSGMIYDVIAGPFMVAGLTEDSFGSLTPEQMETFDAMFHQPQAFVKMGRSVMALPLPDEQVKKAEQTAEKAAGKAAKEAEIKPKKKTPEHDGR